jgi:hypothetical protein
LEVLAYIGAALAVVVAVMAYRYWRSTAPYALRVRESHAREMRESRPAAAVATRASDESAVSAEIVATARELEPELRNPAEESPEIETNDAAATEPPEEPNTAERPDVESSDTPDTMLFKPAYRLIEDLESPSSPSRPTEPPGSVAAILKDLNEQLAALPSGIELLDLPIVERRKVADRREDLLSDRARLLEQKKRGAHRRSRHRDSDQTE